MLICFFNFSISSPPCPITTPGFAVLILISAVANAENNHNLDKAKLYVKEAYVNDGPVLKRSVPDSRGRIAKNDHRTSHVTVVVAER